MYMRVQVCVPCCIYGEDNLKDLLLSSYHVGPGYQSQIIKIGSNFYPLSHLIGPTKTFECRL